MVKVKWKNKIKIGEVIKRFKKDRCSLKNKKGRLIVYGREGIVYRNQIWRVKSVEKEFREEEDLK